jgi:hypothetical protein
MTREEITTACTVLHELMRVIKDDSRDNANAWEGLNCVELYLNEIVEKEEVLADMLATLP